MSFRISKYRDTSFNDIDGSGVFELSTTVYCDTEDDLPGEHEIQNHKLVLGCKAIVIDTGKKYLLGSNGIWVEDKKSGGGGGGSSVTVDTQVLPDSTNPVQNQAIYAFVNSSVATNTASFQGTYHTLAELEAVQNPTNNDYGFVIDVQSVVLLDTEPVDWSTNWTDYYIYDNGEYIPVSGDSAPTFAQNTYYKADGVVYKRYKYNASDEQWEFEYDLNNSSFTAAEWATIQSGFTAADKTKYDGYEAVINSKPGLIETTSGNIGEIFNSYSGVYKNNATGYCSHAEGSATTASNTCAHAEGGFTNVSGRYGHGEGYHTVVSGENSHAEGYNTEALRRSQHVEGEYNLLDTDGADGSVRGRFAHIIGNGTANNARGNAYAIGWDGKIYQPSDPNADSNGVFLSSKADLSMFTAMSESDYEALVTKDRPLYFIYED